MWFVAKPFLVAVLVAAIIVIVAIAVGAAIGLPGIFLALTMAIGGILLFIGAIVSMIRIFKWAVDTEPDVSGASSPVDPISVENFEITKTVAGTYLCQGKPFSTHEQATEFVQRAREQQKQPKT